MNKYFFEKTFVVTFTDGVKTSSVTEYIKNGSNNSRYFFDWLEKEQQQKKIETGKPQAIIFCGVF